MHVLKTKHSIAKKKKMIFPEREREIKKKKKENKAMLH